MVTRLEWHFLSNSLCSIIHVWSYEPQLKSTMFHEFCLRGCVATIISSTLQPIGLETSTTEYNNILLYSAYKYSDIYKMESS